ncbi:MAG: glutathione S-transferase family protein [Pseudomonadales bacterium]
MPRIEHPASPLVPRLQGLHLFHFDGAPCAQRVRFALAEKGIRRGREVRFDAGDSESCAGEEGAWVSRQVSLIRKDHLTEAYALIQPNLVVPALVHDGVLHTESMDIVEYIDQRFGGEPLLPRDSDRAADVRALVALGESLHRSIRFVTFRWGLRDMGRLKPAEEEQLRRLLDGAHDGERLIEFYERYDSGTWDDGIFRGHLAALEAEFERLDRRLGDGRPFLTGASITMADVIWCMKVLRLDECGYPFRRNYPALWTWYRRIARRPAFREGVMGRHRAMNLAFRVKSRLENLFGVGLRQAAA